jgi:hypothetical protein
MGTANKEWVTASVQWVLFSEEKFVFGFMGDWIILQRL